MQDKAKLELRAKPTQPIQVNRPVVLAIVAAIFLAVLLAIIQAFNVTANIKAPSSTIKATTDKPLAISSELNDVPGSYSDVNGIQRYTSGGTMGEITLQIKLAFFPASPVSFYSSLNPQPLLNKIQIRMEFYL